MKQHTPEEVRKIQLALAAPFPQEEVSWKPQAVSGSRALAVAYVDARTVQDRLDEVLGVDGWQDSYEVLGDGPVKCSLQLWMGCCWVQREDVGGQSEQEDAGDQIKAAFSDALKRAAVKFGVGRYLYSLPKQWCDYDPHKKQFVRPPQLPAWAIPLTADEKAVVASWELDVQELETAQQFNDALPGAGRLPGRAKAPVWQLLKAAALDSGLLWDEGRKAFFNPKEKPA